MKRYRPIEEIPDTKPISKFTLTLKYNEQVELSMIDLSDKEILAWYLFNVWEWNIRRISDALNLSISRIYGLRDSAQARIEENKAKYKLEV